MDILSLKKMLKRAILKIPVIVLLPLLKPRDLIVPTTFSRLYGGTKVTNALFTA